VRCLEKTPRSAGTVSPRPVPAPHENPTESFQGRASYTVEESRDQRDLCHT